MDIIERFLSAWFPGWLPYYQRWFGYRRRLYPRPPWRWNRGKLRWELRGSEGKSYVCTESVIARIEGRPPRYPPDPGEITDTDEIEAKLQALGWQRGDGECNCGCEPGQNRNCVVVYWENGMVGHAAIFDHVRCDWGSKLGARLPVARFRRPEDYYVGEPPAADAEMRFYCPGPNATAPTPPGVPLPPGGSRQKADEEQHASARDP